MIDRNSNQPGYKIVKMDGIPKGWEYLKIKKVAKLTAGGTPSTKKPEYWNGTLPWMSSGELNYKRVFDVNGRITEMGAKNSSTKLIPRHSVLVGLAGQGKTRGTVAINEIDLYTNQSIAAIICEGKKVYYYFIFYNLDYRYEELRRLSTGDGGRGGLNLNLLGNLHIILPSLPEQKKIADILSTWDKAIDQIQKLIDAKQRLKKGLMQQLLTGKMRFKEFVVNSSFQKTHFYSYPSDWDNPRIVDFSDEVSERNSEKDNYPVLTCSKYNGLVNSLDYFGKKIYSEDTSLYKVVQRNQFAFPTNHVEEGSIGMLIHLDKGVVSPIYTVFAVKKQKVLPEYLYLVLKTSLYRHIFSVNTKASVNRRGSLRWDGFSKIRVPLPKIDEQKIIYDSFNKLENEIKTLAEYLKNIQMQKRGLMQKLLTGEIRVKLDK